MYANDTDSYQRSRAQHCSFSEQQRRVVYEIDHNWTRRQRHLTLVSLLLL